MQLSLDRRAAEIALDHRRTQAFGHSLQFVAQIGKRFFERFESAQALVYRLVRKCLFFWALRAVQRDKLKLWYADFQKVGRGSRGISEHRKMKGLIALMRKLSRSLWYVHTHQEPFDYAKVFPGRPLEKRNRRRRRKQVKAN